jgi:hypothetical protein
MRTTPLLMAAAAAFAVASFVSVPAAHAIDCVAIGNADAAAAHLPPSAAAAAIAACERATGGLPQTPGGTPAAPSGPCRPSPGLNQNCGQQSNEPGLCALTGVCIQYGPAGQPPAAPPPPPTAGMVPGEIMPGTVAPTQPLKPVDPGQCVDLAYYVANEFHCAQVASPPPGWHPGMGS